MRARCCWCVAGLLMFPVAIAWGEEPTPPAASQITSCPTVLPAEEGERSIVVPSTAQVVQMSPHQMLPNQVPHVASRTLTPEQEANRALLQAKLAQRDALQREIAALRETTRTPEQILVNVKMLEVNRTKLRGLGVDWSTFGDGKPSKIDVGKLLGGEPGTKSAGVQVELGIDPAISQVFDALVRQGVGRVLAAPATVVVSGQPASISVGGEFPIPQPDPPGGVKIQKYGTELHLLAVMLGENRVRIELRPRVSELDEAHGHVAGGKTIPGLLVREIDTAMEMELGTTMVMSGLVQERKVATANWLGRKSEGVEEIALVVVVTPEMLR